MALNEALPIGEIWTERTASERSRLMRVSCPRILGGVEF